MARKSPFWGLLLREIRRYLKVPYQTLGTPFINALLYLFIFGLSLGRNITLPNYSSYLFFLIPGLIMLTLIKNAFENSSSSIVASKYAGELIDLRITPLKQIHIACGYSLAGLSRGLIVALITFITSIILAKWTQGELFPIMHPFILLYFLIMAGLSFASLGLAIGLSAKNFDMLNAISSFLLVPLIYLGGVFFSLETLHPVWQTISKFNPLLYLINGVRYGFLGHSDVNIAMAALISLCCFILFFTAALLAIRKGKNYHW